MNKKSWRRFNGVINGMLVVATIVTVVWNLSLHRPMLVTSATYSANGGTAKLFVATGGSGSYDVSDGLGGSTGFEVESHWNEGRVSECDDGNGMVLVDDVHAMCMTSMIFNFFFYAVAITAGTITACTFLFYDVETSPRVNNKWYVGLYIFALVLFGVALGTYVTFHNGLVEEECIRVCTTDNVCAESCKDNASTDSAFFGFAAYTFIGAWTLLVAGTMVVHRMSGGGATYAMLM